MKLTTWNVNGVRAREPQLLEWIRTEQPDVLCLQETKASREDVPETLVELDGYWCYWHGYKGYSGVALHVKKSFCPARPHFFHPAFDEENRIVAAEIDDLVFASIYVPNGGKDFPAKVRFLEALERYARELKDTGKRAVLCGDYNVARTEIDVHAKLRKPEQIGQTAGERAMLERIIAEDLVDLSRQFEPNNDQLFTWWAPWRQSRERNIGWRLDLVLCSPTLAASASRCAVFREFGLSDHGPVAATFDLPARTSVAPEPEPKAEPPPAKPSGQLAFDL